MPNIKSAIKRVKVIETKTARNNSIKSGYKSAVKKFESAVETAGGFSYRSGTDHDPLPQEARRLCGIAFGRIYHKRLQGTSWVEHILLHNPRL